MAEGDTAVLILAGGEATRLPSKLEKSVDGEPMILRAYRNACETHWPVYVSAKGSFPPEIDARLECPFIIDRWPKRGPLAALFTACDTIEHDRVFVLAADEPRAAASLARQLDEAWQPGDEAIVPEHDGRAEPLAAMYARSAVLREAFSCLNETKGGMHDFLKRLQTRYVGVSGEYFANVNTPEALARVRRDTA